MHRPTLRPLALALLLVAANGCAGSHKHAEVPDFTEKGWSDPSPELTSAKADPPIQPSPDTSAAPPPESAPAAPASAPEAGSAAEAAVISGDAPPPPPKVAKPRGAKRGKKKKKPS